MPALSLEQLTEALGGRLLRGRAETVVSSYTIDSRRVKEGGVFVALAGERTDGHRYLAEARQAGAAAAVVERDPGEESAAPAAVILVEDGRSALTRCAGWIRRRSDKTRWIALTGSNGKTTTKELIAEGLATSRRVHRTPGNFNNELGVPLTVLAMPDDSEFAVIEMAMSGPEEIARLTRLVDPDVGLVTNIRAVHMASFASIDDVAAAKGELFALLRDEAVSVVNLDDLNVRVQGARHAGPRVTFGQHASADLRLEQLENRFLPGASLSFHHEGRVVRLQMRMGGAHSAHNALAALAAVVAAGGDLCEAAARMEQVEAGPGRGRIHRLGRDVVVVDDSYNCSPPALAAVLETLSASRPSGRAVLALGDMLELGPMEAALHREAGRRAWQAGVQMLIGVGPLAHEAAENAQRSGLPEVHHFAESRAAAETVPGLVRDGDLVVVKGSRGIHMGRIVRALIERFGEAP